MTPIEVIEKTLTVDLASKLEGYVQRPGQIELARAITQSILDGKHILAEAPTGTGKSFSTCLPAAQFIVNGWDVKRVVVVTASIALQEQLIEKDLPFVAELIGEVGTVKNADGVGETRFRPTYGLLKGLSNYACLERLNDLQEKVNLSPWMREELDDIVLPWAESTQEGDVSELESRPRGWNAYSAMSDDCLGRKCPFWSPCFGKKAQARARLSDIVVTNYHMLLLALDAMPKFDVLICDEAHNLADIARNVLGFTLTEGGVRWAARKWSALSLEGDFEGLINDFWTRVSRRMVRKKIVELESKEAVPDVNNIIEGLSRMLRELSNAEADEFDEVKKARLQIDCRRAENMLLHFRDLDALPSTKVFWSERYESHGREYTKIECRPIDVSHTLYELLFSHDTAVALVSATIQTNTGFNFVLDELGLHREDTATLAVDSPFDLKRQGMLIIPSSMPSVPPFGSAPATWTSYYGVMGEHLNDFVQLCDGRVLALFTSWKALNEVIAAFRRVDGYKTFTMKQGEMSKGKMIADFKERAHGVLFGVASFWEGIDIPGMQGLFIDKMPFPTPSDPLFAARSRKCEAGGGFAFTDLSVPMATLKLRQGVGRLIRKESDKGFVMIADKRLLEKNYGKGIVSALPPFKKVRRMP